ncbi:MAG: hypothetical protein LBU64_01570 [Planctomycetota bacterium]|jgi:hypothetical protein|nr:hypothetical protein [Planctomycetota bacterium]
MRDNKHLRTIRGKEGCFSSHRINRGAAGRNRFGNQFLLSPAPLSGDQPHCRRLPDSPAAEKHLRHPVRPVLSTRGKIR